MDPLVYTRRLHQLRCAVEAVTLLINLPSSFLAPRVATLSNLLVSALQAATTATCAMASLGGAKTVGAKDASDGEAGRFHCAVDW